MSSLFLNILKRRSLQCYSRMIRHSLIVKHCYYFNSSSPPTKVRTEKDLNKNVSEDILRKRLIFRCKNRGIKELDLLMGNWANKYVETLSSDQCDQLQTILNEETLDLVDILIKREQVPDKLNNDVMQNMIKWRDAGNITGYAK